MPPIQPGVHYSQCEQCRRPVRQAVACPVCGRCCCRRGCYANHVARHMTAQSGSANKQQATQGRQES